MARTPKSKTQRKEPLTPGEATIVDPKDPAINTEENTAPEAVILNDDEALTAPEVQTEQDPTLPEEEVELPEDQKEHKKVTIPKVDKESDEKPIERTTEEVPPTENDANATVQVDPSQKNQMNPQEAMAYCMTQPVPKVALAQLRKQRRLLDITGTYQLFSNED